MRYARRGRRAGRVRAVVAAAALAAASLPLLAQTMKPGLWEVRHQVERDATQQARLEQMRKQIESMPPAQRQQMEAMMARQGAASDPAGGGTTTRVCVTAEDVARQGGPVEQRPGCTYDPQRSGATTRVKYVCTQPPSQGEIEVTTVSPERYTMAMHGSGAKGHTIAMRGEGRWLGADCGDVKPRRPPAAK